MPQRLSTPSLSSTTARLARGAILALAAGLAFSAGGCRAKKDVSVVKFEDANKANLALRWITAVGLHHEKIVHVWRVEDTVFVATSKGQLYSINAASGKMNWEGPPVLGVSTTLLTRPQFIGEKKDSVLVIGEGRAYVLSRRNGDVIKSVELRFSPATDPVVTNNRILIGDLNNYFYGLYVDHLGDPAWLKLAQQDSFRSRAVLINGSTDVAFASQKGLLVARSVTEGTDRWVRKTNGEVVANLAADDTAVYVPTLNNQVFAFADLTGELLWNTRLEGRLDQAIVPDAPAGEALVVGSGQGLYALTLDHGDQKWFKPGISGVVSTNSTAIYATDHTGELLALDPATGDTTARVPVDNLAQFGENTLDNTIYVATKDGRIAAYDPPK